MSRVIGSTTVAFLLAAAVAACSQDSPTESTSPGSQPAATLSLLPPETGELPAGSARRDGVPAAASASSTSTLVVGEPADARNAFPFGSKGVLELPATRYQQAYASGEFAGHGPMLIRSIGFIDGGGNFGTSNYRISLSTITTGIDGLSNSAFDANRGPDNVLFASLDLSGAAPTTFTIPGSAPFPYDPALGNLLLDVVVSPGGVLQGNPAAFASRSGTADGVFSRYHDFGGGTVRWGLVTVFELAPLTAGNLLEAADHALASGTLVAAGPAGGARAWLNLLASAQRQAGSGNPAGACAPLEQAYLRVDGEPRPDDFVTGPAASSFAALIEGMRNDLGC